MIFLLIGALAVAAGATYWLVARRRAQRTHRPSTSKSGGRFGAVEIRTRDGACQAAQALAGQRYLAKDAPALPLAGCTSARCSCTFGKLVDRRTETRRLLHGGLSASLFLAASRRKKRERRRAEQPRQKN
jgi:hypothetical protein